MLSNRMTNMAISDNARHFLRCELVLAAIESSEKPTLEYLVEKCNLPQRTIYAIFKRLSDQHRVSIVRVNGRRHGYYRIVDWGNLDRRSIVDHIKDFDHGNMPDFAS